MPKRKVEYVQIALTMRQAQVLRGLVRAATDTLETREGTDARAKFQILRNVCKRLDGALIDVPDAAASGVDREYLPHFQR